MTIIRKLKKLKSAEKRAVLLSRVYQRLAQLGRAKSNTAAIFVAGMQRSGTTMLMNVFELHPEIEVYEEAANSRVFDNYRVRDLDCIRSSLDDSRSSFCCYKIICDSHLIRDFLSVFPDSKFVWIYRNAYDNAESALRKFPHATSAVRLVAEGQPGGGWFGEGVQGETRDEVQRIGSECATEFDFACLTWWARNRLYFDLGLNDEPRVKLLKYEAIARDPARVLCDLMDWLEVPRSERAVRFVHPHSVEKPDLPEANCVVAQACDSLFQKLDSFCEKQRADGQRPANDPLPQ